MCSNQVKIKGEHVILKYPEEKIYQSLVSLGSSKHVCAYLTACTYFVVSVAAEIRSSELHVAQERESTHGIAALCSILFSDGIRSCPVFTKRTIPQQSCSSVLDRIIRRKKHLNKKKK